VRGYEKVRCDEAGVSSYEAEKEERDGDEGVGCGRCVFGESLAERMGECMSRRSAGGRGMRPVDSLDSNVLSGTGNMFNANVWER
jgi:hypothetical protein